MFKNYLSHITLFFAFGIFSICDLNAQLAENLKEHILYLADDKLEGRASGSEGELLAAQYISKEYKEIGLSPIDEENAYFQYFDFIQGYTSSEDSYLEIDDQRFEVDKDFFILPGSPNGSYKGQSICVEYGIDAPKLNHNDYDLRIAKKANIFIIKLGHPDQTNPHSEFSSYATIDKKIEIAREKGAEGIIFIGRRYDISKILRKYNFLQNVTTLDIPVSFLDIEKFKSINLCPSKSKVTAYHQISPNTKTTQNVLGFIDNNAMGTVILGAHYDHLGHGQYGSLSNEKNHVHNGADDNASGVALLIELARQIKKQGLDNNNYLFICFSGEELGLFGSGYYVKNPTVPLDKVNYMLNFDMVGRLDTLDPVLAISGSGTSPHWSMLDDMSSDELKLKLSKSGIGPSDHTSFYFKDIPVLHFFSGAHSDYHKPSDDEDKINYDGIQQIDELVWNIIEKTDKKSIKIPFTKTKEENKKDTPRFTVGLGVIPDYLFDGEGLRIEGVIEGKNADKANLEDGDVVIKLGEMQVTEIYSYMEALSHFNKGDTTIVKVKRGDNVLDIELTFY